MSTYYYAIDRTRREYVPLFGNYAAGPQFFDEADAIGAFMRSRFNRKTGEYNAVEIVSEHNRPEGFREFKPRKNEESK